MFLGPHERHPILTALLSILGILLAIFVFRGFFERGFSLVQRPFASAGTWVHQQTRGWTDASRCSKSKIEKAEQERIFLAVDFEALSRLKEENEDLKKRLSFAEKKGFRLVSGQVIARTSNEESRTFLIDRGTEDGVNIGQPAIIENGVLVGKVIATTRATATVSSLTDPLTSTAAAVLNKDRTVGITRGLSGSLIRLQFVPHNEKLNINDLLVTSGLESDVPSGLLIGTINSVKSDKAEPFQEAVVEPFADMRHRGSMTVIIGFAL